MDVTPITTDRARELLTFESTVTIQTFLYELGLHENCRQPREQQIQIVAENLGCFADTDSPLTVHEAEQWIAACRVAKA